MSHLLHVLFGMAVITFAFAYLWIVGLPVTLACLGRERTDVAVLIAPVTGISLLSLAHHYVFYFLLLPYSPGRVHLGILALSAIALIAVSRWRGVRFCEIALEVLRTVRALAIYAPVPVCWLVSFCSLFWQSGIEMLSASQDELCYVEVARQLMTAVNTGSPVDLPFGRADHYLDDFCGTSQAYLGNLRLGGFFLLGDLSAAFGIPLEVAFPLVCGVFILVAIVALPLTLAQFFRLPRAMAVVGQVGFAFSGLLIVLHFQGSLSHLTSTGFRLSGLAVIIWALALSTSVGSLVLAVILALGWFMAYYESASFGLIVPIGAVGLVACWRLIREERYRPWYLLRAPAVLAALPCLLPRQFSEFVEMFRSSLMANVGDKGAALRHPTEIIVQADAVMHRFLPTMLGLAAFYDDSSVNYTFYLYYMMPVSLALFIIFVALAILGFCRLSWEWLASYGSIPFCLAPVAIIAGAKGDLLVSIRATQMVTPFLVLGMICLVSPPWRGGWSLSETAATEPSGRAPSPLRSRLISGGMALLLPAATLLLAVLAWCNIAAVSRTIAFVNSHDLTTDPKIRRLNPNAVTWQKLRNELRSTDGAPFLLSGFDNTPTPHWLALATRPLPHLLGTSVTDFWRAMSPKVSMPATVWQFISIVPAEKLKAMLAASPASHWDETYPRLLAETKTAVVPNSSPYPIEWGPRPILAGPESIRFLNVCDVVIRDGQPSVTIGDTSALLGGYDELGPYWLASHDDAVQPNIDAPKDGVMEVRYSGPPPRISAENYMPSGPPQTTIIGKETVLRISGHFDPKSSFSIEAQEPIRLRAITFYRFP